MQLAERLHGRSLPRVRIWEPWGVLLPLVGLQWLALVAFVLTVRHNGWLFYQGGDETFFYTSAWSVAHGHVPDAAIGWGWSYVLAPVAALFGSSFLLALPAIVLVQTLVLLPLGLLAFYGLAARLGGRLFGYVAASLWVLGPYLLIPLWDHRYHQKYVEQFLPQSLGLTGLGDFPSMIVVVCAAYLVVRVLDERSLPVAALGGVVTAFAIGIKPANALFLAGVVLAFAATVAWRETLAFAGGLVPGLLALLLWKDKGLGNLPFLHSSNGSTATILIPAVSLHLSHYVKLDWHQFWKNRDGLREFFWSVRVVDWFMVAGALGAIRRAPAKGLLVAGWFGAFLLVKGTSPTSDIEEGTFLRLFMPALPALILLVCSVVFLVPTYGARLANAFPLPRARPLGWRARRLAAPALALGIAPAVLFAALPPLHDMRAAKLFQENTYVPMTSGAVGLRAVQEADGVHLVWHAPRSSAKTFYRVYRTRAKWIYDYRLPLRINGVRCNPPNGGAADCHVELRRLVTTRATHFVDRTPLAAAHYAYRIGVMANYTNDLTQGDVLMFSKPVVIAARQSG